MNAPDHRDGLSLARFPVHLGRGGSACAQGEFTGMAFYADYEARTTGDGPDGRLVSLHSFSAPWDSWEMHPSGDELVVCTAGGLVLIQDTGGETCSLTLSRATMPSIRRGPGTPSISRLAAPKRRRCSSPQVSARNTANAVADRQGETLIADDGGTADERGW